MKLLKSRKRAAMSATTGSSTTSRTDSYSAVPTASAPCTDAATEGAAKKRTKKNSVAPLSSAAAASATIYVVPPQINDFEKLVKWLQEQEKMAGKEAKQLALISTDIPEFPGSYDKRNFSYADYVEYRGIFKGKYDKYVALSAYVSGIQRLIENVENRSTEIKGTSSKAKNTHDAVLRKFYESTNDKLERTIRTYKVLHVELHRLKKKIDDYADSWDDNVDENPNGHVSIL